MNLRKLAWLVAAMLSVVAAVFAAQNAALIEYRFLHWTVELRRSAVVAVCLLAGFMIGWLFGASRRFYN